MDSTLLSMSKKELKVLKAKIEMLLENKPDEFTSTQHSNTELFLMVLGEVLKNRFNGSVPPIAVLRASRKYRNTLLKLYKAVAGLNEWAETVLGSKLNRLEKLKLYNITADLICDYLYKINIPINLKTVVNCSDRLPSLIDRAFPGYVKSGLFHIVLKAKEQKIKDEYLL